MTQPRTNGPDPVDGLRLALLQKKGDELRQQLRFRTFGMKEGLMLFMLACGLGILAFTEPGRSHTLQLVLGWGLIAQAVVLYWSLRQSAAKHLKLIEERIAAAAGVADGAVIAEAASSARELLVRKP